MCDLSNSSCSIDKIDIPFKKKRDISFWNYDFIIAIIIIFCRLFVNFQAKYLLRLAFTFDGHLHVCVK